MQVREGGVLPFDPLDPVGSADFAAEEAFPPERIVLEHDEAALLLGALRARPRHVAADPERADDHLGHGRTPRGSVLGGVVFAGRVHVPVGHTLVPAEVALRADVIEDRIVSVGVLDEEVLVGAALLALLGLRPDVLPAEHYARHAGAPR